METFDWNIPSNIKDTLENYVQRGYMPGTFTAAVLANDLTIAVMVADPISLAKLRNIVQYVVNEVPADAQGSYAKVKNWVKNVKNVRTGAR
jgi:hypothetical protein